MNKFFSTILWLTILANMPTQAQVTIGSSKKTESGALLMLDDGTTGPNNENAKKGLGLPRVELQAYNKLRMGTTNAAALDGQEDLHTGLVVYNIADETRKCELNYPTTGLYVWDGASWQAINAESRFQPTTTAPGPISVYAPNSYIAKAGANVTIPVDKAFAIWDWWGGGEHPEGKLLTETSAAFTGNLAVAVLWQETEEAIVANNPIIESVSFDVSSITTSTALDRTANIYVKIKAGAIGNAVVTLQDDKQVRWSWHIWVPKDDPTTTTYTHNTGRQTNTFMDRNVGASRSGILPADREYSIGLGYQWGRKDPFPDYVKLSGTKTNVPVDVSKTLANVQSNNGDGKATGLKYSINYPLGFIKNTAGTKDWYSAASTQWDSRWGYAINECDEVYTYKSETDPCPEGWKVPSYIGASDADSPWAKDGVSSTTPSLYTSFRFNKGYYFTETDYNLGWYPSAGFRNYDGITYDFGIHGDYWSASPNGYNARYYNVNSNAIRPYSLERGYSFSIRCIKE